MTTYVWQQMNVILTIVLFSFFICLFPCRIQFSSFKKDANHYKMFKSVVLATFMLYSIASEDYRWEWESLSRWEIDKQMGQTGFMNQIKWFIKKNWLKITIHSQIGPHWFSVCVMQLCSKESYTFKDTLLASLVGF